MDDAILSRLHDELGWPAPEHVLAPIDEVASMFASSVRDRIQRPLERIVGVGQVRTGVLTVASREGEAPRLQVIVCEFGRLVDATVLAEAHRLAWNFCHAPILVTIDPVRVCAWTCYERPTMLLGVLDSSGAELTDLRTELADPRSLATQAAAVLSLASLASGNVVRTYPGRFSPNSRADRSLLRNLKSARKHLLDKKLSVDLVHDLLARLMFVQFLFDRKDKFGRSALDRDKLSELRDEGVLQEEHDGLASILRDKSETYRLFRWLDARFNGDLFPGKSGLPEQDEAEWAEEAEKVTAAHLWVLADLVSGAVEIEKGQANLWRLYSFETMPLEFVSCIYEEFVDPVVRSDGSGGDWSPTGAHYTPIFLVDFVLDGILPWDGEEWNLRILDPACGSGVFLVRSFQRLIHRWKRAHPGLRPHADVLRNMLETSVFGVDRNPHAVRVASFSLYLAMCDEIDPRDYWTSVRFPILRNRRLACADFFDVDVDPGTLDGGALFDVVVGNAPWGQGTLSEPARVWAKDREWEVDNKDVGVLFVPRSAQFLRERGRLALLQSAGSLLLNRSARETRRRLFASVAVEEIVNLALVRRRLFPSVESPTCLVTAVRDGPTRDPIAYVCPKLAFSDEDYLRIGIEADDVAFVRSEEWDDPWTWTVLMLAGRRDLTLLRRLRDAGKNLASYVEAGDVVHREGVIPQPNGLPHEALSDLRYLSDANFPPGDGLLLDGGSLEPFGSTPVRRRTNVEAFGLPQMIVKQSFVRAEGRFKARLCSEATVCTQSYVSFRGIRHNGKQAIEAACLTLNSRLATYYMSMTNGRMAYRSELRVDDFLRVPFVLGDDDPSAFRDVASIDDAVERRFGLQPHEVVQIEDAMTFLLPEIMRDGKGPGTRSTSGSIQHGIEDDLVAYCDAFLSVLEASTATTARRFSASVVMPDERHRDLDRIAAIHIGGSEDERIRRVAGDARLTRELETWWSKRTVRSGVVDSRRVITAYASVSPSQGAPPVPTIILVRPDERRYWSRSKGMRDADEAMEASMRSTLSRLGSSDYPGSPAPLPSASSK